MAVGQSGGRSAGNRKAAPRIGTTPVRRATPRERDGIDPPGHSEWEHIRIEAEQDKDYRITPTGSRLLDIMAWGLWTFTCVFFAILVCAWWGLI